MNSTLSSADQTPSCSPINREILLSLSGGGMRAVIFHLGMLQRLAASSLLESVKGISTVSGGSLAVAAIFAHSGMRWPSSDEYTSHVFPQLKKIVTQADLVSLGALGWKGALRYNRRLFYDRARILADQLRAQWDIDGQLRELPDVPVWHVNSTCIDTGKNWRFSKREMGDWQAGRHYNPPFSVAEAASASAAVPYVIGALRLRLPVDGWQDTDPATRKPVDRRVAPFKFVRLWDGGAYENLGLEAFYKFGEPLRGGNFLICSDASGPLNRSAPKSWRSLLSGELSAPRLFDISSDQIRSLRSRMLVKDLTSKAIEGVLVRMGNSIRDIDIKVGRHRDSQSYDAYLTDEETSLVLAHPTDLRAPSKGSFDKIARHGFEVTDSTLNTYAPEVGARLKC